MRVLYSHTRAAAPFWTAGGSVGHTLGVAEALTRLADTRFVGNCRVYGLANADQRVIPMLPGGRFLIYKELLHNLYYRHYLAAEMAAFQPDFVYHRLSAYSWSTARVCERRAVPLVLEFNSSERWKVRNWKADTGPISGLYRRVTAVTADSTEPYNIERAALITTVSAPLRDTLLLMGVPDERIVVNPNGVNTDTFAPVAPEISGPLRQKLGLPTGRTVVGFCGTFGGWHGIPELTESIERVAALPWNREVCFLLIGDGPLRPEMQARLASRSDVFFAGSVPYERIQDYLSLCDILVAPNGKTPDGKPFFGSPTKLFEYMSMGKGIVASNLDQIGRVLEQGETALLVEPGDVGGLVEAIGQLVAHPEQAARLGAHAREVAIARHTWTAHVQRILDRFEALYG